MFSLESPHRGVSNEHTQRIIIYILNKITLNYSTYNNVFSYGIFSQGLKNELEIAVVNEPSVFEPLNFDCKMATIKTYIGIFDTVRRCNVKRISIKETAKNIDKEEYSKRNI